LKILRPGASILWGQRASGIVRPRYGSLSCCRSISTSNTTLKDFSGAVDRYIDMAEKGAQEWTIYTTKFVEPAVSSAIEKELENRDGEAKCVLWGGFANASRARLILGHKDIIEAEMDMPDKDPRVGLCAALRIKGTFMFSPAKAEDFVTAALLQEINEEELGDAIVEATDEQGGWLVCTLDAAELLKEKLKKVKSVQVETKRVRLKELPEIKKKTEDRQTVEKTPRLDAIVSGGLRISREKASDAVKGGFVKINFEQSTKPGRTVVEGDVLELQGTGKKKRQGTIYVKKIEETIKGRFRVDMTVTTG